MIEQIKRLERIARQLEPDTERRHEHRKSIIQYTEDFLDRVYELPAYILTDDKGTALYDSPITEGPSDIEPLINIIKTNVDRPGINPASGGHLGYIPGGGIYDAALGDYLAAITNRYSGVFFASPGAVRMENMLIRWMAEIVGYPRNTLGNLTSGGSIANLIGITTARDAFSLRAKDFPKAVIYLTRQVHHSIDKAIRIAGLRETVQRYIPGDDRFRMQPEVLQKTISQDRKAGLIPWLIIASAGTTDTGAVDPLDDIASIAASERLWLHTDGAYGAFFMLCEEGKKILKGIEKSDAIVMDPHKGLFLPYGSGAILVKDTQKLLESYHYQANYMQDALSSQDELSPADLSPELTKHFRGLRLWLPLKLLGVRPFRAALEEKLLLARYFHQRLQEIDGFEVGPCPELSVVTFRYIPKHVDANEFNKLLVQRIQRDGRIFLSSTTLEGIFILRLAILSFRTHLQTIDKTIEILKEKVENLETNSC